MAANPQAEVQALLRFLTKDAKIPLAAAMPKISLMRKHDLGPPESIAKADPSTLKPIFDDDKVLKQVQNAAKRMSNPKKRAVSSTSKSSVKRNKTDEPKTDEEVEKELALPFSDESLETLRSTIIETNRAPLFLAFAITLLKYTQASQPLSSRLSLAQAVTSAGAQSKAKYIGLTNSTAEDEGWAQGQPKIKVMGREIAVMRRQVHVPAQDSSQEADSQVTIKAEEPIATTHEAFWGIDLEALKKSNGPLVAGKLSGSSGPPVHTPQSARSYLLKSIDVQEQDDGNGPDEATSPKKTKRKLSPAEIAARKERAVAMLLQSLDLLCESWASTLSIEELDRRASSWYSRVRPDVEPGKAGWGQRGKVPLHEILDLQRHP